jgi:hypothetical protein
MEKRGSGIGLMFQSGLSKRLIVNVGLIAFAAFIVIVISAVNGRAMPNMDEDIGVLELRNYLLKPNTSENFQRLFNEEFVGPMNDLGGHVVGQFQIDGAYDHFVWMRGYNDMQVRLVSQRFLHK